MPLPGLISSKWVSLIPLIPTLSLTTMASSDFLHARTAAFLFIFNLLGASNRARIGVAYMDVGQGREQERKLCGF